MKKDKFIIVSPYQMNAYYKEGYEYLAVFTETYATPQYNSPSYTLSGTIGNDPLSVNLMGPSITEHTHSCDTKIIMVLNKKAEILYGEKREIDSGNSSNSQQENC